MTAGLTKKRITDYSKAYWREILAFFCLLMGIYFLRQERHEIGMLLPYLRQANHLGWLFVVTGLFVLLQAGMYVQSFLAVHTPLKWRYAVELFLKRNLLSVFLPGGGVSALAYVPLNVKKAVKQKVSIYQASALFGFAGVLSTLIISLPVLFLNTGVVSRSYAITALVMIVAVVVVAIVFLMALQTKGRFYRFLHSRFASLMMEVDTLSDVSINKKPFAGAVAASIGVELCGIVHLYLAMLAVGATPSLAAAGIAYIVATLLMVASPFLKGLGAVELSLVYVLSSFGYVPVQALAIVIIYRVFEFWLPLLGGLIAFLLKGKDIFLRLFPAFSVFFLGVINFLSVLTPPLLQRFHWIRTWVPREAIHASNLFVLLTGFTCIITATFLVKGWRTAWWIALVIALLSIPTHLIKALDYEEAMIAAAVGCILLLTRRQYRLKSNPRLVRIGLKVALAAFAALLVYGIAGFYFLKVRHFGVDFTWQQSVLNAIRAFVLLQPIGLAPKTAFGREFITSAYFLGGSAWLFLLYTFIKPYWPLHPKTEAVKESVLQLVQQYGHSTLDYFKITGEKLFFLSARHQGFIAYAVTGQFAIVLEEPVCAEAVKTAVLREFEAYCRQAGLKTAFYRVGEHSLNYFTPFKKRKLLIGQEAIMEVSQFSLNGKSKKALRNTLNSLKQKGYSTRLCPAPQSDAFLQELKAVSDEWLQHNHFKEINFAQGTFDAAVLKNQDVIAVFLNNRVVAFLNIVPDFAPDECTYDLIRKTAEAPAGCMDALLMALIQEAQQRGWRYLNLGLVPLSGVTEAQSTAEQLIQYAYARFKRFRPFQGSRAFKEKYASTWVNKYLVYENDFDLLQLPAALNKVMKYPHA